LHPDKLAQRGLQVTPETKAEFLKVKEAYDILSDPKRRRLYDELGSTGLKLIESPTELSPTELLRNFQKNRSDRLGIALLILLIFAALVVLPVLFCLKCDGKLDNAPWTAIWTPMWVFDGFLIMFAVSVCLHRDVEEDEEGEKMEAPMKISLLDKWVNFLETILLILIQVFILIRLDDRVSWSWGVVFIPWYIYESFTLFATIPSAFFTKLQAPSEDGKDYVLDEEHGAEEIFLKRIMSDNEFFEKRLKQHKDRISCVVTLLRIWLAAFLAIQLDGNVDWNWGLVLLPIWVYLLLQYVSAYFYTQWGKAMQRSIPMPPDGEASIDPVNAAKLYRARALLSMGNGSFCFMIVPIFIAIVLVCRLQVSVFSTFVIMIPVFIALCCCCCTVCCGLALASCVDLNELDALEKAARSGSMGAGGSEDAADPENPDTVVINTYEPPAPVIAAQEAADESKAYGTFESDKKKSEAGGGRPAEDISDLD
jgi:hypothetical protein